MHEKEKMIAIYIPEALIPNVCTFKGEVLLCLDCLKVLDGFTLGKEEFVASVVSYSEGLRLAGLPVDSVAIIQLRG
ncbi:hypothetical protein [Kluyvera intermedia]|uniref:hypothetical protein n=1 Tax=Kluyvera intermedia TaxID=61648 RepID=UPI0035267AB2